ncbi:recombinase family protein [Paenibacillus sp. VTT E-133280]|uniref:recombinase family protein n=1 Tax=Paenibacillus sp. VTT E-133280 TaxID=1986222 RepID=UPI0015C59B67|nr:recombinase family protein [Paenibacillus sp. VTT E-133280]
MHLKALISPGMRGVFYGRHSTDKQTMDAQRSMALEIIRKYECEFVGEYLDTAVSARKKDLKGRNGISILLAHAHLNKYDFVVISQHDRLARKPSEHQEIRSTLKKYKIPVIIASTESLYDSGDLLVDLIKDGNSKFEVDNTRVRTRDTMYTFFKQGKWRGGKPPFGYRYNSQTKLFEAVEHELLIVKKIFSMYLGYFGFDKIAQKLPFNSYDGCEWTDQAVRAVITNPFYAGYLTRGRKKERANNSFNDRSKWEMLHSDRIPAAVTLEKWERCWELYDKRVNGELPPRRFKTSFLLKDLLRCETCGCYFIGKDKTTTGKSGEKYGSKYYWCSTCDYRVELNKAHEIIDFLMKNLRQQHASVIIQQVLMSIEGDIMKLGRDCDVLSQTILNYKDQLSKVTFEIDQQFILLHSMDVEEAEIIRDNVKTLIRILTLSKQSYEQKISVVDKQLIQQQNQIKQLQKLQLNQENVKSKLEQIKVEHLKRQQNTKDKKDEYDSRLFRGLLFEFVQEISIDRVGNVRINARHDLLYTEVK